MIKPLNTEFDVQAEFEKMKSQVAELFESLKERGETGASKLNGKLASELGDYRDAALKTAHQMQDASAEGVEQVTHYVKINPMASLSIAFGVGFALSRLLSAKHN